MTAYHRTDGAVADLSDLVVLADGLCQLLGLFRGAGMGDVDDIQVVGLCQMLGQGSVDIVLAAHLFLGDQLAFAVQVDDGLDAQSGAHNSTGSGKASAAVEVSQVVHRDPVADPELVFLQPVPGVLNGTACLPHLHHGLNQGGNAAAGAEGVHDKQLAVRIAFPQVLCHQLGRGTGSAQTGGEGDIQHIPALAQQCLQGIFDAAGIGLGGAYNCLGIAQGGIELLSGQFPLIRVGQVFLSVNGKAQRYKSVYMHRVVLLLGQIGAGIHNNGKSLHKFSFQYRKSILIVTHVTVVWQIFSTRTFLPPVRIKAGNPRAR